MTIRLNKALAYKFIVNEKGHPHSTSVEILDEIVAQYDLQSISGINHDIESSLLSSPLQESGWKTSYEYFKEKFGYTRYKVRYAFWKLEDYGLIKRHVIPKPPKGTNIGGSELYILLNLEKIRSFLEIK